MQACVGASRVKVPVDHVVWFADNCHVGRMKLATVWLLRQAIKQLPGGVLVSVDNRFLNMVCRTIRGASG